MSLSKKTSINGTEYDFSMQFLLGRGPKLDEQIESGVQDDNGNTHHFSGAAIVVAVREERGPGIARRVAYVRKIQPIQ